MRFLEAEFLFGAKNGFKPPLNPDNTKFRKLVWHIHNVLYKIC